MSFNIEELTEDLLKSTSIFLETLSNLRYTGDISLERQIEILSKINNQDGHIFVAVEDNKYIISTSTILIEQKFIRNGGKVGHIEDVATNPCYLKRGIGHLVVNRCVEYAKERGCYKVILDCSKELIDFYSSSGFRKEDEHMRMDLK